MPWKRYLLNDYLLLQGIDYARYYSWARIVVDIMLLLVLWWALRGRTSVFGECVVCVGSRLLLCGWVSRAPQHLRVSSTESATGSFCFSLLPSWERTASPPTVWFPGCKALGSPPFSPLPHKSCISSVNKLSLSKAFSTDQVFGTFHLHCPLWQSLSLGRSIGKEKPFNMCCSH